MCLPVCFKIKWPLERKTGVNIDEQVHFWRNCSVLDKVSHSNNSINQKCSLNNRITDHYSVKRMKYDTSTYTSTILTRIRVNKLIYSMKYVFYINDIWEKVTYEYKLPTNTAQHSCHYVSQTINWPQTTLYNVYFHNVEGSNFTNIIRKCHNGVKIYFHRPTCNDSTFLWWIHFNEFSCKLRDY